MAYETAGKTMRSFVIPTYLNIWGGKKERLQRFSSSNFLLSSGPQEELHFLALLNELFTHVNSCIFSSWRFLSTVFWPNPSATLFARQGKAGNAQRLPEVPVFWFAWMNERHIHILSWCICESARAFACIRLNGKGSSERAPHLDIGARASLSLYYKYIYMNGPDYYTCKWAWCASCKRLSCENSELGILRGIFATARGALLIPAGWTGPGIR